MSVMSLASTADQVRAVEIACIRRVRDEIGRRA